MTISMIVFWGLVIVGVIALVRYLGRADRPLAPPPPQRPAPEQVLAKRAARGEIDADEYRQRLETLRSGTDLTTS